MSNANQWTAPVFNMAGVSVFEDEFPYIPSGDYQVSISETSAWKKKGEQEVSSVIFRMRIAEEGPHKGKSTAKWIGLTVNVGNTRNWKHAYLSCGYKAEGLEANVQPAPEHFLGKTAYIHIESPPLAEGQKLKADDIEVNFLTPQTYAKRKAEAKLVNGNGATATQAFQPSSAAPGLPAAPSVATGTVTGPVTVAPQPPGSGGSLFGAPPAPPASAAAAPAPGAPPPPPMA
jgi:hypothetical protein